MELRLHNSSLGTRITYQTIIPAVQIRCFFRSYEILWNSNLAMPIPDHSCVPEKSLTASRRLLPTGASRPHAASKVIFHRSHAASMLSGAISTARVKQNRSLSHNDSTGMSKFSRTDHSCLPMSHSWHYLCESAVPRQLVSPNNTGNFGVKLGYAHSQPQLRSLENSNLHGAKAYCTLMPGWSDEQVFQNGSCLPIQNAVRTWDAHSVGYADESLAGVSTMAMFKGLLQLHSKVLMDR